MDKIFYIITSLLFSFFFIIWLTNFLVNLKGDRQFKKTLNEIRSGKKDKKTEPKPKKTDEKRSKDKQKEAKELSEAKQLDKQQQELAVLTKVSKYNEIAQGRGEQQGRIVGTVKPVGRWSQAVIKQKMGFLKLFGLENMSLKNFWQNMIKAQAMSQGKDRGKGR